MKSLFFIFLALWISYPSRAQYTFHAGAADEPIIELGSKVTWFLDSASDHTIGDMTDPDRKPVFTKIQNPVPNFSGFEGNVWFRFTLKHKGNSIPTLSITNTWLQHIQIFQWSPKTGAVLLHETGFYHPFHTRGLSSNFYLLPLPQNGTYEIIGCLRTIEQPFWVPMRLGPMEKLIADGRFTELIVVAMIGMMFIMLLYNISLGVITGDKMYLSYTVYVGSALFYLLYTTTFLYEWFWPDHPDMNSTGRFPVGLVYLTWVIFVNHLLEVRQNMPRLYDWSVALMGLCALVTFSGLTIPLPMYFIYLLNVCVPIYVVAAVKHGLKYRTRIAVIFLVGWVPLMITSVLYGLMMEGSFYNEFIRSYAIGASMVWETVVFSLTLGYRYNIIRQERISVQAENMRILENQRKVLELRVRERTKEITEQNRRLLEQEAENRRQRQQIEIQNHNLEAAVEERTRELAQTNETLKLHLHKVEQFSFITAHNLRSPVARLLGLTSIFNRENPGDPSNTTILDLTAKAATDLDNIIRDLGSIIRLQKGEPEKISPIGIKPLLDTIIGRFQQEIEDAHILIDTKVGMDTIHSVPAYVDSILFNLISNSIKHRAHRRQAIIHVDIHQEEDECVIEVCDNGKGFDMQKNAAKVFEPFQRFDPEENGKGLGLFLLKSQLTSLGGTVCIDSTLGEGTRAIVRIPNRVVMGREKIMVEAAPRKLNGFKGPVPAL